MGQKVLYFDAKIRIIFENILFFNKKFTIITQKCHKIGEKSLFLHTNIL